MERMRNPLPQGGDIKFLKTSYILKSEKKERNKTWTNI